jgi:actin-related protein 5
MLHNFCEVATDFPAHLRQLKDPLKLRASETVVQFPFILPVIEEKTEEELLRIAEKRKEQGRKLQEMAAKTREEKVCASSSLFTIRLIWIQLLQKENELQRLLDLKARETEPPVCIRKYLLNIQIRFQLVD